MTVARSASLNIASVLNAVGATANALTTTVNGLASAADTFATHAEAWSTRSKAKVSLDTVNYLETIRDTAKLDLARQKREIQTELSKDADLRTYFDAAEDLYTSKNL